MSNKRAPANFHAAEMSNKQAEAVARRIPDWSQFATKTDLDKGLADLRHDLTWRMVMLMAVPIVLWVLERLLPG